MFKFMRQKCKLSCLFPFRSFLYNSTLDNLNHVLGVWQVEKRKKNSAVTETLNLFQNNPLNSLTLLFLSLHFKLNVYQSILINPCHLIPFSMPSKWIVDDTCIPSPSICLSPYSWLFASSSRQLKLPLTCTFFDFPWRFELAGVNWIFFKNYYYYYKWIVKVNCNYFTLYKALHLKLKIIWSKRVNLFVCLCCRILIRRSHGSRLSATVKSDSICFYWNGMDGNWSLFCIYKLYQRESKINCFSWFLSRDTSRLIEWIYKERYQLLLLQRKQQLNNSVQTAKLKLLSC